MNDPNDPNDRPTVGTYLTDDEAKEIHKAFMGTFTLYVGIAVVAHALMFIWKPWFTGGFG